MELKEAKIRATVYSKELSGLREFYRRINETHYRRTLVHYNNVIDALDTVSGSTITPMDINLKEVKESIDFLVGFSRISKGIKPFFEEIKEYVA